MGLGTLGSARFLLSLVGIVSDCGSGAMLASLMSSGLISVLKALLTGLGPSHGYYNDGAVHLQDTLHVLFEEMLTKK